MHGWSFSDGTFPYPEAGTVPVGLLGGLLRSGKGWRARCLPLSCRGHIVLLTPSHVLDGAGTSRLTRLWNSHQTEDLSLNLELDKWFRHPGVLDLAAYVLSPRQVVWSAMDVGVPIAVPILGGEKDALVHIISGRATRTIDAQPIGRSKDDGDSVFKDEPVNGESGSGLIVQVGAQMAFAGILTSAYADDDGAVAGFVRSDDAIDFVNALVPSND